MPETTTTTDLPTITLDPSLCCCGTTTTPKPYPCKCMLPFTLDFRTNVVAPITLEINMPRGNSGFPAQNLFFKSYIYGCHSVGSSICRSDNTLKVFFHPSNPTVGAYDYSDSSIEEPANCNIGIRTPSDIISFRYPTLGGCSIFDYYFYRDYLSYVEGIYGYLPPFIDIRRLIHPSYQQANDFSFNGSAGLFICCKQGILQDLLMNKVSGEIQDIKINRAVFTPNVHLRFPFFTEMVAGAWKRGELDNLTLYGPITLKIFMEWGFSFSVVFSKLPVPIDMTYYFSTCSFFVKILQFPFFGGSVSLDPYGHHITSFYADYYGFDDPDAFPSGFDRRTRLSIVLPDILNAIENMRAILHFGEIIPNPSHSGDGTIDWEYVYKGWRYPSYYEPYHLPGFYSPYFHDNPFQYC